MTPSEAAAAPFISIVVPAYNDEEFIRESIQSCLDQTDGDFEVVAVDDCSSDATADILEEYAVTDARIRVVRQERNRSAFQARRTGVLASRGRYVIFLDGDDVLAPEAVAGIRRMSRSGADLLHFGCKIISRDGTEHPRFEAKLLPTAPKLSGTAILDELFLDQDSFEGHLWNKAYLAEFVQPLFASLPDDAHVPRANDLPVSLMIAAQARTYVSTPEKLYTYHFGSGGVTAGLLTTDRFLALVEFRPSFDITAGQIDSWGLDPRVAATIVRRMRDGFVARSFRLLGQVANPSAAELEALLAQWPAPVVLPRLHTHFEGRETDILPLLERRGERPRRAPRPVKTIALYLDQQGIGGMQRVVSLQARLLVDAGYHVVVLGRMEREDFPYSLPEASTFVPLTSPAESPEETMGDLLAGVLDALEAHAVDAVILHANYRPELIHLTLAIERTPVRSILTLHSFSLRAIFDRSERFGFLRAAAFRVDSLAVLSRTDETFWRLAGVDNVRYVPNPVDFSHPEANAETTIAEEQTPVVGADANPATEPAEATEQAEREVTALDLTCDVLWVGRYNERIKRISEVIRVFALVARERPGARLHIVGPVPRGERGTRRSLQRLTRSLGIEDSVRFLPAVNDVDALIRTTSVVMLTSIIEGFPNALVEPLLAERPVVMYDLPYLEVAKGNPGIHTVPWGDRERAAAAVLALLEDDELRERSARDGLDVLRKRFSADTVLAHLRDVLEPSAQLGSSETADAAEDVTHARIIIQQLFPLFHDSLSLTSANGHDIEAFYRTWYGSRTIRYSERLGAPIVAARRYVRRLKRIIQPG